MSVEAEPPARPGGAETGAAEEATQDKDVAIAMVGLQRNEIDPEVAARAVRKTDWFLIPAMIVGCTLSPSSPPGHHQQLTTTRRPRLLRQGDPWLCGPLRHDE